MSWVHDAHDDNRKKIKLHQLASTPEPQSPICTESWSSSDLQQSQLQMNHLVHIHQGQQHLQDCKWKSPLDAGMSRMLLHHTCCDDEYVFFILFLNVSYPYSYSTHCSLGLEINRIQPLTTLHSLSILNTYTLWSSNQSGSLKKETSRIHLELHPNSTQIQWVLSK